MEKSEECNHKKSKSRKNFNKIKNYNWRDLQYKTNTILNVNRLGLKRSLLKDCSNYFPRNVVTNILSQI